MAKKQNGNGKFVVPRIPTGIPNLDEMMDGGLPKNTTTIICGASGTCKTLLSLQYLYSGATLYDEPGVFISFAEPAEAIYQHGKVFGWDLEGLAHKNKFAVIRYEPHEVVKIMEEGGGLIRDMVESVGAKRLVIDSLTAYELLFDNDYKKNESILYLFDLLRKWGTTSLVTSEVSVMPNRDMQSRMGFLTDSTLFLYHVRRGVHRIRALEIFKMRDTFHDDRIRFFSLEQDGIRVLKEAVKL